jgi:hypothetical protein
MVRHMMTATQRLSQSRCYTNRIPPQNYCDSRFCREVVMIWAGAMRSCDVNTITHKTRGGGRRQQPFCPQALDGGCL